ncbi:hypothetical protein ScPMuIL_001856 [Solemya velum]
MRRTTLTDSRDSLNNDQKENGMVNRRKRKNSSPNCGAAKKTKMTWAIDSYQTVKIYQEMGVDPLCDDSNSNSCRFIENTPSIQRCSLELSVPVAPRVLVPSQKDNLHANRGHCDTPKPILNILRSDSNFLCRRNREIIAEHDHFSNLSDEMILDVFRWLPKFTLARCARVCRRWSRLVVDEALWKRTDLANKTLIPGVLGSVLSRGVCILRLTKASIQDPIFTGPCRQIKASRLSRVQLLDLSMAEIGTQALLDLFSICRDLKKLSLENIELNDQICSQIGENRDLEVLNMCMCRGITVNGMMPILSNCLKLESLNLAWTGMLKNIIVYLSLCLPTSIRKINLSGCRDQISDADVKQLAVTCPDLKELDLSDCTVLTCQSVYNVTENLHFLEYLAISRCYHILPSTLPVLNKIGSLLAVDVFGMLREGSLQQLKESMRNIEINKFPFSSIARPTTGVRRTSIWGCRVRDSFV